MFLAAKYNMMLNSKELSIFNDEDIVISGSGADFALFKDGSSLHININEIKEMNPKINTLVSLEKTEDNIYMLHIKIPRINGYEIIDDETSYRHIYINKSGEGFTEIKDDVFNEKEQLSRKEVELYLKRINIDKDCLVKALSLEEKTDFKIINNIKDKFKKKAKKSKRERKKLM